MHEKFSLQGVIDCVNDAVIVTDAPSIDSGEQFIVYVNPAFTQLTGYPADEVIGKSPKILQGPDTDPETREDIHTALEQCRPIHTEILNYTRSGQPYWVDLKIMPLKNSQGEISHFVSIGRDITEYKSMQEELYRLTLVDAVTGTTNSEHFMSLAESEFYRARRYQRPLAIVRFDLDNFKRLHHIYGKRPANNALKCVADNCRTLLRKSDIFGRIGGEKFALLLPETEVEPAEELADRLCMLLSVVQVRNDTGEIPVTASFGVTITGDDDDTVLDVFERADAALADAKRRGKNTVRTRTITVEKVQSLKNY